MKKLQLFSITVLKIIISGLVIISLAAIESENPVELKFSFEKGEFYLKKTK